MRFYSNAFKRQHNKTTSNVYHELHSMYAINSLRRLKNQISRKFLQLSAVFQLVTFCMQNIIGKWKVLCRIFDLESENSCKFNQIAFNTSLSCTHLRIYWENQSGKMQLIKFAMVFLPLRQFLWVWMRNFISTKKL